MKKHNEGYALVLVLVVMAVLTIVVTSVLSLSLRNLQAQQKSIQRMEDKYAAQGAIEIVVANLEKVESVSGTSVTDALQAKIQELCKAVYGEGETGKKDPESNFDGSTSVDNPPSGDTSEKTFSYSFTVTSQFDSVKIVCNLELSGKIKRNTSGGDDFSITTPKVTYKSYEISKVEPVAGGTT